MDYFSEAPSSRMTIYPTPTDDALNELHLKREQSAHIVKAARSATIANVLAPLLCIPMFDDEVSGLHMAWWLGYMLVAVALRTWIVYRMPHKSEEVLDPHHDLKKITFAVGIVGLGWGLGWPLMTPDLSMVNRMIYVYMTTAALIASMFAYSVNRYTFYAFTLPIMLPAMSTVLWPVNIFPWPFSVGLASLYLVVLSIANNFAKVFENSVRLQFRNEHLYQALASERDQSVAANVAKSKFIAVASHDLRQPLHAVNVNLDLFHPDYLIQKDSQLLQRIKNSILALNAMFDALLNVSKLDAYVTKVENREFALSTLVESVRELVLSRAEKRGLSLIIEAPSIFVWGDKLMLQQILMNLVMNALQYTEQGQVKIQFSVESNCLAFSVVDTGVGISSKDQQQIFNEFYRVDRTRGVHEGLGLGLTIVKRLCDLMDATIQVKSALGQGSAFTVTTPCPVSKSEVDHSLSDASGTRPVHRHHSSLHGKCIAIFEDDKTIIEAYRQTLAARGAGIVVLSEVDDELQQQLESINHIDCILSDYRLQRTTGEAVIEILRENYNSEIPAVIVTADTSPAHIHLFDALKIPVLHKPVTFQQIVSTIEDVINRSNR